MPDEKPYKYENLPIPSYEEATSSRANTPVLARTDEAGNDEERQGLMGNSSPSGRQPVPTRRANYRPPHVSSNNDGRDSLEDVDFLPGGGEGRDSADTEDDEVRREMQEMEVSDPPSEPSTWTKRISSISQSLSFIHFPFRISFPKWKFKLPAFDSSLFIVLGRIFAVFLVVGVIYLLFISGVFRTAPMQTQVYPAEMVRLFVQENINASNIRVNLEYLTSFGHVAGTEGDYIHAKWVQERFEEARLEDVRIDEFGVYLNYPKEGGRAVELLRHDGTVEWEAQIEEDQVNLYMQQTPVFHGHSKAGDVKGPLIFANYGSREDFKRLYDSGIETTGAIALVKYYGSQGDRALKVKAAELAGFVGCIIYSDPTEDGFLKGDVMPNGRYLPSDGVQRGSVSLMSWVVGDVLTPGWASRPGAERLSKENNPGTFFNYGGGESRANSKLRSEQHS
jgi:PA domain